MKYISMFAITLLLLWGTLHEARAVELKMISSSFNASYSSATSYNDNFHSADSIDHAENYGVGVEMKMSIVKGLRFTFGYHYLPMKVTEWDPYTAFTRTDYPYAASYWSQLQTYRNRKTLNGESNLYDVSYEYLYYMTYHHLILGVEYAPLEQGMFRPYISAGIAPILFGQKGYFVSDITGNYEDANGNFLAMRHYRIRSHAQTRNKHRGYIFNGFVTGGFEIMIHKYFGFDVKARYFRTIHDNKRNRITGYYNINAGIVIYQL